MQATANHRAGIALPWPSRPGRVFLSAGREINARDQRSDEVNNSRVLYPTLHTRPRCFEANACSSGRRALPSMRLRCLPSAPVARPSPPPKPKLKPKPNPAAAPPACQTRLAWQRPPGFQADYHALPYSTVSRHGTGRNPAS
jgi:hypothetical protein